jgi:hypothetical protein
MDTRRLASCLRRFLVLLAVTTGGVVAGAAGASATPILIPAAHPTTPVRTVGPLFPPGNAVHSCTASVVASRSGDLVLTAAHCFSGPTSGWRFVPGYANGTAPFGSWRVIGVFVSRPWRTTRSPLGDVAVLTIAPQRILGRLRTIESIVGANRLGSAPARGATVSVPAYALGTHDRPQICRSTVSYRHAYPTFVCGGYVDGTSGAPWLEQTLQGTEVVGVVGGLHQGGCLAWISYSAPFGPVVRQTMATAARASAPRSAPTRPSDGCATGL